MSDSTWKLWKSVRLQREFNSKKSAVVVTECSYLDMWFLFIFLEIMSQTCGVCKICFYSSKNFEVKKLFSAAFVHPVDPLEVAWRHNWKIFFCCQITIFLIILRTFPLTHSGCLPASYSCDGRNVWVVCERIWSVMHNRLQMTQNLVKTGSLQ